MATRSNRKLAVITGASSGIGKALAHECAAHEYDLIVCAEDGGILDVAEELGGKVSVFAVQADLTTFDGVEQLWKAIQDHGRPVDALMLNAGVGVGGAFVDTELADELSMIALNCVHTVHLAKRVIPEMVKRGSGRVLITGSVVSTSPNPFQAIYAATKAFLMSFGEAIRYELKDTGVTVTVLQPGATDTNFFARAHLLDTPVGEAKKDAPALVAKHGFAAMIAGKDSVLGGSLKSRVEGLMNEILPETFKAKQAAKTTKPKSHA
jgi:short-subunit dehydrogenase